MNKSLHATTDRLSILPLTENDHHFIYELVNTEGWLTFIGNRNVESPAAASDHILKILDNEKVRYWVVRLQENQMPLGVVTFIQRDYLEHPDIGFAFLPNFSGNGYAYEATKAVLDALIAQENLSHILATTIPENVRSIHLLKKIGLDFERAIERENEILHVYGAPVGRLKAI
ncbi:MAG: GNAT family N-acetyltransferase [Phycisphaerae bacterium]|nr:GNAT family N-acetyltransferase [Saprospiraceae bacterium]